MNSSGSPVRPWPECWQIALGAWVVLCSSLVVALWRAPLRESVLSRCHRGAVVVPIRRTWVLPCHARHPKFKPGQLERLTDATYVPVRPAQWWSGPSTKSALSETACLRAYTRVIQEQWTDWPECGGSPWVVSEQLPWPHAFRLDRRDE